MPARKSSNPRSKNIEKKSEDRDSGICCHIHGCRHSFWGIVMVVIGFYWLAKSLGWIDEIDIPLVPLAIIVLGVYFIIRSQNHRGHSSKRDES